MKPVCYVNKDSPGNHRDILSMEHFISYFLFLN